MLLAIPIAAAILLGLATFSKPLNILLVGPIVLLLWWRRRFLAGAVVAVGNAPTALFRLLEMLDAGASPPAAVIGLPVGFVGAMESKEALAADGRLPFLIVRGRRGGSAMAAAAVNALASDLE